MKKVLMLVTIIAVALSFGVDAFSACKCNKRPSEMNKVEKIRKNIDEAKEKAKQEEAKKVEEDKEDTQTED